MSTGWGHFGALWGVGGIMGLVIHGLQRLVPRSLDAFQLGLEPAHWVFVAVWVPLLAWTEGYRGFQGQFSPMVAARARYLRAHPRPLHVALAPLFCLGLLHATRRRWIRSFALTAGIVLLVILVRLLEQPWRGSVDLGVVAGLSLGLASLTSLAVHGLTGDRFEVDPEVPGWTPAAHRASRIGEDQASRPSAAPSRYSDRSDVAGSAPAARRAGR